MSGQEVDLTATEYRPLSYLAYNAGRVVTPAQLLKSIWGEEWVGGVHLIQATIGRLRKKLKDNGRNPKYILTKHGMGYIVPSPTGIQEASGESAK